MKTWAAALFVGLMFAGLAHPNDCDPQEVAYLKAELAKLQALKGCAKLTVLPKK